MEWRPRKEGIATSGYFCFNSSAARIRMEWRPRKEGIATVSGIFRRSPFCKMEWRTRKEGIATWRFKQKDKSRFNSTKKRNIF